MLVIVYDLSSDGFFFNLGSTCVDESYSFYAFYNINNIYFFQLGNLSLWLMTHLWWFWNVYKSVLLWPMFSWFFLKVHPRFFPFNLCKKFPFLWHHILNQHIHIDTMYPSGITHFNTMIFISLCENCKSYTYWYHLWRAPKFLVRPKEGPTMLKMWK